MTVRYRFIERDRLAFMFLIAIYRSAPLQEHLDHFGVPLCCCQRDGRAAVFIDVMQLRPGINQQCCSARATMVTGEQQRCFIAVGTQLDVGTVSEQPGDDL